MPVIDTVTEKDEEDHDDPGETELIEWELPSDPAQLPALEPMTSTAALHLYWDHANRVFVCCCVSLPVLNDRVAKEDPSYTLKKLFNYPQGFERFYRVLQESLSFKSKITHSDAELRSSVFHSFLDDYVAKKDLAPVHKVFFKDSEASGSKKSAVSSESAKMKAISTSSKVCLKDFCPLDTLVLWLAGHYTTTCIEKCHGFFKIRDF